MRHVFLALFYHRDPKSGHPPTAQKTFFFPPFLPAEAVWAAALLNYGHRTHTVRSPSFLSGDMTLLLQKKSVFLLSPHTAKARTALEEIERRTGVNTTYT